MRLLTFASFLLLYLGSYSQTSHYQVLISTALDRHGALFVSSKPIKNIRLDQKEMETYFYLNRDYASRILDTLMFAEIVRNSKTIDTTLWQDNELKKCILVSNTNENVSTIKALEKLAIVDKKQKKSYSKQISHYNSMDPYNRNLFYISRPVFDNSKRFAIVQWDNGHSGLGGGGGIVLFQFQSDRWEELGIIMSWKY